jgi:hypothetical protein
MRKTISESDASDREGIFYVAPFPQGWRVVRWHLSSQSDKGHPYLWAAKAVKFLAWEWGAEVDRRLPKEDRLRQQLAMLVYACPRGRIVKVGKRFKVYHGNDLEPFMDITRAWIEARFDIAGRATWEFDDHERCQQPDKEAFRKLLGIKEDWKAVDDPS